MNQSIPAIPDDPAARVLLFAQEEQIAYDDATRRRLSEKSARRLAAKRREVLESAARDKDLERDVKLEIERRPLDIAAAAHAAALRAQAERHANINATTEKIRDAAVALAQSARELRLVGDDQLYVKAMVAACRHAGVADIADIHQILQIARAST